MIFMIIKLMHSLLFLSLACKYYLTIAVSPGLIDLVPFLFSRK